MKICILLLLISARVPAATCSRYLGQNPMFRELIEFLQPFSGLTRHRRCSLEFHLCNGFADNDGAGSLIGDLLIKKRDQIIYLPIYLPEVPVLGIGYELSDNQLRYHNIEEGIGRGEFRTFRFRAKVRHGRPHRLQVKILHRSNDEGLEYETISCRF